MGNVQFNYYLHVEENKFATELIEFFWLISKSFFLQVDWFKQSNQFYCSILVNRVQRVLGLGLGLVEASEARSLDEAEAMFFFESP